MQLHRVLAGGYDLDAFAICVRICNGTVLQLASIAFAVFLPLARCNVVTSSNGCKEMERRRVFFIYVFVFLVLDFT